MSVKREGRSEFRVGIMAKAKAAPARIAVGRGWFMVEVVVRCWRLNWGAEDFISCSMLR